MTLGSALTPNLLLTPTQLSTHLACAHYTQLERKRRAGELEIEFMPDPRLEAMRSRGEQHERAYIERLRLAGSSIVDLGESRDPHATLAAMREGAQVIVQAPLGNEHFFGIADVLLRVGESYEPVDTKLARETRAGTILQLCTYCEMLGAMQGVEPEHFHVVTPEKEETYRTADFAAYFRLIRSRLLAAVTPAQDAVTPAGPTGFKSLVVQHTDYAMLKLHDLPEGVVRAICDWTDIPPSKRSGALSHEIGRYLRDRSDSRRQY